MHNSTYQSSHLDRLNPEFIGIAARHGSFKRKREEKQKERNELLNHLTYKINIEKMLAKSIEKQKQRLRIATSVHSRRQSDNSNKKRRQNLNEIKLRDLSLRARDIRQKTTFNIKQAKRSIETTRHMQRKKGQNDYEKIRFDLQQKHNQKCEYNKTQFKLVKQSQRISKQTVNNFYKTINGFSLQNYRRQIEQQNNKCQEYNNEIDEIKKEINNLDQKINYKKNKIYSIVQKINQIQKQEYPKDKSLFLPLYLRETKADSEVSEARSISSRSSKPKDILLRKNQILRETVSQMI